MYSSAGFTGLDCTADGVTWQRLSELGLSSAELEMETGVPKV